MDSEKYNQYEQEVQACLGKTDEPLMAVSGYLGLLILYPLFSSKTKTMFVKRHLEYSLTITLVQTMISLITSLINSIFAWSMNIIPIWVICPILFILAVISLVIWGISIYNLTRTRKGKEDRRGNN